MFNDGSPFGSSNYLRQLNTDKQRHADFILQLSRCLCTGDPQGHINLAELFTTGFVNGDCNPDGTYRQSLFPSLPVEALPSTGRSKSELSNHIKKLLRRARNKAQDLLLRSRGPTVDLPDEKIWKIMPPDTVKTSYEDLWRCC